MPSPAHLPTATAVTAPYFGERILDSCILDLASPDGWRATECCNVVRNKRLSLMTIRATLWCCTLFVVGCAVQDTSPPEPIVEKAPVTVEPPPAKIAEPARKVQRKPDPPPVMLPPKAPRSVAVLLSGQQTAYVNVALELSKRIENAMVFDLSDKNIPAVSAFRIIDDMEVSAVVAVGLQAAVSAISFSDVPVVFCQVFNINDNELITDNSRGIAVLPPLMMQIAAWKKVHPSLRSIGAIIGYGHDELIAEAEAAAAAHDIQLHIRHARSDRETLYLFNRLVSRIDGFWVFPDNRVLSATVLREMLEDADRHGVQTAVFSDAMLQMGASISSSSVASNIADTAIDVMAEISRHGVSAVAPVTPLSDIRIVTNSARLHSGRMRDGIADEDSQARNR